MSQVSNVLRKLLPDALDADIFAISDSKPPQSFLSQCHVVDQTGQSQDSNSLQSRPSAIVTAVVDRTANISEAAKCIALSRRLFRGKSHYAPDLVLVSEWVADELLTHLIREIATPLISTKSNTSMANGHANGHVSKPKSDSRANAVRDLEGKEGLKVVVSGENGAIVEVTSR